MSDTHDILLLGLKKESRPFPHFYNECVIQNGLEKKIHNWLNKSCDWSLTETEFYEQFEFNLLNHELPAILRSLVSDETIKHIVDKFKDLFSERNIQLVGVMAHKLIDGQRIGIHNDYINGEETHRLVLHFNPEWREENGGYLMLFNSSDHKDVAKVIAPLNNSAFGFEISSDSHHAVSRIYNFSRYTIVYTFRKS